MPRTSRRLQLADAAFHVFNRGHNRETVFADDTDRRCFLDLVARYQKALPLGCTITA